MEKCRRMKRKLCVKELDVFLTVKVLENTQAVLSLGKLCDKNGYSCEWVNVEKPHLIANGIRIPCNTETFVPIVVRGLSNSSSGSVSSTSGILSRGPFATSSSSSSSSHTVWEIKSRERKDQIETDTSPVTVSTTVDERWKRPDMNKAKKIQTQRRTRMLGRSRNWPKSKLAEVEQIVFALFLLSLLLVFSFTLSFAFRYLLFLFLLISLFILFLFCFCVGPVSALQKHQQNSTKGPQEREKEEWQLWQEEGKKEQNLGSTPPFGLHPVPFFLGSTPTLVLGSTPFPSPFGLHTLLGSTFPPPSPIGFPPPRFLGFHPVPLPFWAPPPMGFHLPPPPSGFHTSFWLHTPFWFAHPLLVCAPPSGFHTFFLVSTSLSGFHTPFRFPHSLSGYHTPSPVSTPPSGLYTPFWILHPHFLMGLRTRYWIPHPVIGFHTQLLDLDSTPFFGFHTFYWVPHPLLGSSTNVGLFNLCWALHPSGHHFFWVGASLGFHPSGFYRVGPHHLSSQNSTKIGWSQNWPKLKLAEVEIGRSRSRSREHGDPLFTDSGRASSEILEWLQEFREKFGGWWNSTTGRFSRQFFSWSLFRADCKETSGCGHGPRLYVCHQMSPNAFICVSPNAFICVSPNGSVESVTELASFDYLCSFRSTVFQQSKLDLVWRVFLSEHWFFLVLLLILV